MIDGEVVHEENDRPRRERDILPARQRCATILNPGACGTDNRFEEAEDPAGQTSYMRHTAPRDGFASWTMSSVVMGSIGGCRARTARRTLNGVREPLPIRIEVTPVLGTH